MPITFLLSFICVKIGLMEITIPSNITEVISKIMATLLVFLIGYCVYVVLDIFLIEFWKTIVKRVNKKTIESLTSILHGIFKVIIILVVLVYVLHYWGVQITPLLAGLGIAGLAVALAIQPTLANIFSGIAMILDDSARVGDLVYLDANTKGKILSIGLRSTKINTFDNETIIIPNSKLADSTIQNVALPEPKSRVVIPFSVAYGTDINKVKEIILKELKVIKIVCKDPEPYVRFIEMGSSSLNFKAYYFVDNYDDRFTSIDEANTRIYNVLRKNKIEIPFQQLDVHMKKD
jgi:small-conductance mechanosensitive channel